MALDLASSPQRFAEALVGAGLRRAWIVRETRSGGYRASHPDLRPLAEHLAGDRRDGRDHEAVFLEVGSESGALLAAVIHKTVRGQAQGGVRHQAYASIEALLHDGLRLSVGMTRKNALAGLWWGGGKGLIARAAGDGACDGERRRLLYREYGAFVSSLRGCYVTAEDAGTGPDDMAEIFRATRFATCIPPQLGGAGNPSALTAEGVACAMEAALRFLGRDSLAGCRIAVQGAGQVGSALIRSLLARGVAGVVASEVCAERRELLLDAFADQPVEVRLAAVGDVEILAEPCDVLAPCALGAVLDPKTIAGVRAAVVCGSANNPLVDEERDALTLQERGIVFVPDVIANRMGIVLCANEQYGRVVADSSVQRHLDRGWEGGIHRTTLEILERARARGTTPSAEAIHRADEQAEQPHPIWGHRSQQIIDSLLADGWEQRSGAA